MDAKGIISLIALKSLIKQDRSPPQLPFSRLPEMPPSARGPVREGHLEWEEAVALTDVVILTLAKFCKHTCPPGHIPRPHQWFWKAPVQVGVA